MDLSAKLDSDIISFSFFGQTIIVLNSNEAAHDLLEKRSNIHSGRFCPPMIASPSLMNMKDFIVFTDTNELWRKQRRMINSQLGKHTMAAFRASQELEVRRLLVRLLSAHPTTMSSDLLREEFCRTTSALFLQSVYGYELKSPQDPFFTDKIALNEFLSRAVLPAAFLVNVLPWMEHIPDWMPGAGWKQTAYEGRVLKDRAMSNPYKWAKDRFVNGTNDGSIVSHTYNELRQVGWSEADADDFSMARYPDVQEKARHEIDTVVGTDRLPSLEDQASLPFVARLLTEVVRWHPTVPLGVPHVCTEENEYRGYRIPKGAIIIGHTTAIVRDERVYKNADTFDPDRYLDSKLPPPPVFGWGQRVCPGQHFFKEVFFLEVAMILATLKIEGCEDENGNEVVPTEETEDTSTLLIPVSFQVKISPRSEHHTELIGTAA
ncbi:unnamed protein product [Rhizoctonia solani]|uniref:O-methylsterigmatocystin oxidoreductase n=1 Tax=Rhizoctonia solani TaxID=456999 RepID=A0A8H3D1B4_9AGAM|nr:unnamed protein product [Rhizoctonia solani]